MTLEADNRALEGSAERVLTRRGPLRPEQLVSVRKHQDRRLAGYGFNAVDTVFLIAVAIYFVHHIFSRSALENSVFDLIPVIAGTCSTWLLLLTLNMYRAGRLEKPYLHFARVILAVLVGASVAIILHTVLPAQKRLLTDIVQLALVCSIGVLALHALWWSLVARWRSQGLLVPNVVVVGANKHTEQFIATAIARRDISILGVFDDRAERHPPGMHGVPVLGTTEDLLDHRIMPCVDLVVVTIDRAASNISQIMDRLAKLPNPVTMYFDDTDESRRASAIEQIADSPLAPLHPKSRAARKAFAKRVQDLLIGLVALLIFSVPMLLIAVVIRIESPGPVFFRQFRQGFNNEEFPVWKFRTMRHEVADAKGERQVTVNDDRVTRVGRILRSTSLDELPQLLNVISGEMSLVGPRPHSKSMKTEGVETSELVARYAHRHRIKPGMTGWAAINGSRGALQDTKDVSLRVDLDIAYIERQSTLLDLQIMAKTIPSMLGDKDTIR
jgi:Undecaprenyl-phosphate glucose phosphotransferase